MITFRPGGYKWYLILEKIKKAEKYRIERQRIVDEIEKAKADYKAMKKVSFSQN
jgi:hypothetical protein